MEGQQQVNLENQFIPLSIFLYIAELGTYYTRRTQTFILNLVGFTRSLVVEPEPAAKTTKKLIP